MTHTSGEVGLHVALCCGCGSVRVVELSGVRSGPLVPQQRAVAPAACDFCDSVTTHAYVSNGVVADREATATVRRLVERLDGMGVAVGYLSDVTRLEPGARAVVVETADGWRGIALRPDQTAADLVTALAAAGAALFREDGWVDIGGSRSVAVH